MDAVTAGVSGVGRPIPRLPRVGSPLQPGRARDPRRARIPAQRRAPRFRPRRRRGGRGERCSIARDPRRCAPGERNRSPGARLDLRWRVTTRSERGAGATRKWGRRARPSGEPEQRQHTVVAIDLAAVPPGQREVNGSPADRAPHGRAGRPAVDLGYRPRRAPETRAMPGRPASRRRARRRLRRPGRGRAPSPPAGSHRRV